MSYMQIYNIASQGMQTEKLRLDLVAFNLANQHSVQRKNTPVFTPLQVVTEAMPFSSYIDFNGEETIRNSISIVPQETKPTKIYQPEHPEADAQGFVSYPGVDLINEMTTLLRASRAYEADIRIINIAHQLYQQSLTIGEDR